MEGGATARAVTGATRVLEVDERRVLLNHLDEILWPDVGVTKGDLVDYYLDVADRLLPFVAGRPVSLLRAADPTTGDRIYQKTAPAGLPPWITTRRIRSEHGVMRYADYVLIDDRASLVYLLNLGFTSVHPWACTVDALDRPDLLLLDLDPTEIAFREVRHAALLVRDLLAAHRVQSWVKTSGGRGLHVLVPIVPEHTFAQVLTAAETVMRLARAREPRLFTLDMRRARRRGKILIDVHRNHRGATLVSPWAVREYPTATVSTPLAWPELERSIYPEDFTVRTIRARLAQIEDPFRTLRREPQSLALLLQGGHARRARPLA